jgi:beta-aspartyl-dipeptidase (metallo-type)
MLLLRDADLYAPAPQGRCDVLVGGERVLWLGSAGTGTAAFPGAASIDLAGRRLIPGLLDCHVHITGGGGEAGPHTKVPPVPLSAFTRGGVTTVIGLLGTDDATRSTAELVQAVHALRAEGLSAWAWTGGYHVPPTTLTGTVRGDIALVEGLIGIGELAVSDHRSSQPTLDELLRLASEAHVAGLMSGKAGVVHLHLGDGARGLALVREALATSELPPRVFHPTHVNRRRTLFEEAIALAHQGCTIDVTAFPVDPDEDAWSADEAIRRYWAAGAPRERLTCSSDGGGCLPRFDAEGQVTGFGVGDAGALAGTLRALLAADVPLAEALAPFTSNPARLLRLPAKGQVAVGADADLVVLDPDGGITDVMARGVWHVREGALVRRGTFDPGVSA